MPARPSPSLTAGIILAVVLTLIGYYAPSLWLVYVCKPLATLLIAAMALGNWTHSKTPVSLCILIGLVFSMIGDILLIWPNSYFLPGLAAFFLTHVAYLVGFTRDCKFPARFAVGTGYLVFAALCYAMLFPTLGASLQIPVALYAALLATMAGQAMGRSLVLKTSAARVAALGTVLFLLSDLLLAFHRFRHPLLHSTLLILVPYFIGQWLIASSTRSP